MKITRIYYMTWAILIVAFFGLEVYTGSTYIDKEVAPYYIRFHQLTNEMCKKQENLFYPENQSIKFSNTLWSTRDPKVGQCERRLFSWNIIIDKRAWDMYNDNSKYSLIFHEMTHCVLGLNHVQNIDNYMYPSLNENLTKEEIDQQFAYYIHEVCK